MYKTTDIYLASTLVINGYALHSIELERNKGTFIFADIDRQLVQDFYMEKARVEPQRYAQQIKALTTLVRQTIDNFNTKGRS